MKAVYIHIPFCNSICSYCDFPKVYSSICNKEKYLHYLKKEIKKNYKYEDINTIYIGGGTPSVLEFSELKELLEITNLFKKEKLREFTIECNIESITEEKLKLMKQYGVNRISIGVETFQKGMISILNRHHNKKEAIHKILLAKQYFDNINIDLMYAIPKEKIRYLKKDLKILLKLDVPHISCYSLIIEPHTVLYNNHTEYIDSDLDDEMYQLICKKLNRYHHYEISNFAKEGYESIHNLTYWNNEEYYGFGMGASGYINGIRYENTKNIFEYLNGITKIEEHKLTKKEQMQEEMFLGLRKLQGVNINSFEEKYHQKIEDTFEIKDLIEKGLLEKNRLYIYIPLKYIYISNEIMMRFVGD